MVKSSVHCRFTWFDSLVLSLYPPGWLILTATGNTIVLILMVGIGWEYDCFHSFLRVYLALLLRWLRWAASSPCSNEMFDPNYQSLRDEVRSWNIIFVWATTTWESSPDRAIDCGNELCRTSSWDFLGLAYSQGKTCGWVANCCWCCPFDHPSTLWLPPWVVTSLGGVSTELDGGCNRPKKQFCLRPEGFDVVLERW